MYLSNKTNCFLKAIVKIYRRRLRNNDENDVFFRHIHLNSESKLKCFSSNEVEFCLNELDKKKLIKRYIDGGFAIIPETLAYYDEQLRKPFLRIFWFVSGSIFTAFLEIITALLTKFL